MSRKRLKAEEIVNRLREADVAIAQGCTVAVACKQIGVTKQTYYWWRKILRPQGRSGEEARGIGT